MTTWGTVTVGRLMLRESWLVDDKVNANTGRRSVTLAGQESNPPLTTQVLIQRREDIMGCYGKLVQVQFTDKTEMNGYYQVSDVGAATTNYQGEVIRVDWNLTLERVGAENEVDLESRLTGVTRQNAFSLTGTLWESPAAGHVAYLAGVGASGSVVRVGSHGNQTVYLGVPAGVDPRWACPVSGYQTGAARFSTNGVARSGESVTVTASDTWELHNGLINLTVGASGGSFTLRSWSGGAYQGKEWNVSVTASGSGAVTSWDQVEVLRNDPEMTTVRLLKNLAPGRALLDLSVRRGSRFVEGFLQVAASSTLAVFRNVAEAGTAVASGGYVAATADDAQANRYVVGTAKSFSPSVTTGGLFKSSTTTLDFFLGAAVGGAAAQVGDRAQDLRDQYLGAPAEMVMGVKR